jgi:2-polyprenyl-3-methyl-5-hydroxy-6-metoxy-1,4-benzoquinol methylase
MRLGVVSEGLIEWLALRLNLVPTPLADGVFAMMACRALMAGLRLGLIHELTSGPATAQDLATRLQLDPTGTEALTEALASAGYLERRGPRYRLARWARRWLDPNGSRHIGNLIRFNQDHWEWWSTLETTLQTGQPVAIHQTFPDRAAWQRYVLGMRDLAGLVADEVVGALHLSVPPRRLLDIGGAHGAYAASFCHRYPMLTATVFDLPAVAEIGSELMAPSVVADRVTFRAGDACQDELGTDYDIVLLFDLLHHFPPLEARALLNRAVRTLTPGGMIAILEPTRTPRPSQLAALLHLHYFLASRGGIVSPETMDTWLRGAGCHKVRHRAIRRAPGLSLFSAYRETLSLRSSVTFSEPPARDYPL